jgi:hypothetical protein
VRARGRSAYRQSFDVNGIDGERIDLHAILQQGEGVPGERDMIGGKPDARAVAQLEMIDGERSRPVPPEPAQTDGPARELRGQSGDQCAPAIGPPDEE